MSVLKNVKQLLKENVDRDEGITIEIVVSSAKDDQNYIHCSFECPYKSDKSKGLVGFCDLFETPLKKEEYDGGIITQRSDICLKLGNH